MILCRHCQAENPDTGRFCQSCGSALHELCPGCGAAHRPEARFCDQCGAAVDSSVTFSGSIVPEPESGRKLLYEGGRKRVSVLFADVRGSTQMIEALDPEVAMRQLDQPLQCMIDAVQKFGGVVNRVQGDGIMALFGVPVTCEDHAVRACLAARSMIDAVAQLGNPNLNIRVGIDSGEAIIRSTGRDASDYDAAGLIAHVANRVEQQAASGTALVTGRTARLARGYVEVTSIGRVTMKGLSTPLEMFQLVSAKDRPSWDVRSSTRALNRFVGRTAELAQLDAACQRARLGRGQVVTIVAEAGFGKSRQVHEFLRGVADGTWSLLRVAAGPHTTRAAYHLAAELLRSWLRVEPADDREEVGRKLAHARVLIDAEGRLDIAPIQSLLDLPVDHDEWMRLAPSVRRDRTVAALRDIMLREAELRPLIVLIEDYHWSDPPSADLIEAIVEGLDRAKLLMVVTSRPDRRVPWAGRSNSLELHLAPLLPEAGDELLRDMLGGSARLEPLRQQILLQSGGVPLFIEEIGRSLLESGLVSSELSHPYAATAQPDVSIPASVQAIIATRIDRLPPERRRLLQVASVIGKDVPLNLLCVVADMPRQQIEDEIRELQAAAFLHELNTTSETGFTFRHALIQTVAYEEMLLRHRRELHARVMTAIQTLYADRLDEFTERLAEHALRGECWKEAVSYALKAGDRAIQRWAWRQAVGFYDSAIEALAHLPETPETIRLAIEARLRLRVALPGVAGLARIAGCLEEARGLAESLGDRARVAEIDTSKCLTLTKMGLLESAIAAGRAAHARSQELRDETLLLNSSFSLAQAYWYSGDFRQAEALLTERLPHLMNELRLKQTGTTGTASLLSLVCLAKTYAITGQSEKASSTIKDARRVADETGKPFDLSYCLVGSGFCLLTQGDPWGAVRELEEALRLAREGDIALLIPSSERYLGRAYALAGRLQEARDLLDDATQRTATSGLLGMRLWSSAALAQVQILTADRAAGDTLTSTLQASAHHGFRPLEAHLMRLMGDLHAHQQRAASAESWYDRAITLAGELGMAPEAIQARRDLAALRERAGRAKDRPIRA